MLLWHQQNTIWLTTIKVRLNTRQCLLVVFITNHIISRVVLGFRSFTVLSLGSITLLTLLSLAVHIALASFAPSPSFPLNIFWGTMYLHIFLHWGSQCEVAWWVPLKWLSCYCPGSLVALFRFTRNLPHGFNLTFTEGIKKTKVEQILPKATKKSA